MTNAVLVTLQSGDPCFCPGIGGRAYGESKKNLLIESIRVVSQYF
jgi:hypothetical protein